MLNTRSAAALCALAVFASAPARAQYVCYDQMGAGGAYGMGLMGGLSSVTTPDGALWGNAGIVADATADGVLGRIAVVVYFADYGGDPGGRPDLLDYSLNFWPAPDDFLADPQEGVASGVLGPPINPDAEKPIGQYLSGSAAFLQYVYEWDATALRIAVAKGQRFVVSVQASGPQSEGIMLVSFSKGFGIGEQVGMFASQSIPAGYLTTLGAPYDVWAGRIVIEGSCRADCNQDGLLNVNDFICFQAAWRRRDLYGDFDHSGTFTVNDFVAFQAAWRRGVEGGGCS